jgi:pyruvate dehydrogenase E2 component (dihydrolipoamide acetyltransferase)
MNEPTMKLQRGADDLLRDFPISEPDFEAQAKAIEARLKGDVKDPGALLPPSAGISVDDLLKAPELAAEPGENAPPASAVSTVRTADPPKVAEPPKSNFAEMARKSLQKGEDDAAQAAKELLAATAHSRRPSAEMVERVRAAGRPSATTTPLPASEGGAEEAQRTSGVVARAAAPGTAAAAAPAPINRGTVIGIAGVALAIAACVALFIKSSESESSAVAAPAAEKASQPAAAAPAQPVAPTQAQPSEGVMSPEALAAAPEAAAREVAKGAAPKAGLGAGPVAAAPGKPAPVSASAKPETVVLEDDPAPSKAPPAAEAKAEPAQPEPQLKPAQGSSGNVPLTPSAGAVSTALSSVRGGAQACLAGQTEPVTATVVFAADGHVLSVRAGGPSGPCIQAALSKARITPFAKESFSATTTIRPP